MRNGINRIRNAREKYWEKHTNPYAPAIARIKAYRAKRNRNIYALASTCKNIMVENFKLTITDEHYGWLEQVRKTRGWDSIQDAVRSIIEDAYRMHKKGIDTLMCAPALAGKPTEEKK